MDQKEETKVTCCQNAIEDYRLIQCRKCNLWFHIIYVEVPMETWNMQHEEEGKADLSELWIWVVSIQEAKWEGKTTTQPHGGYVETNYAAIDYAE